MSLIVGEEHGPVNTLEALARGLYHDLCWDIRSGLAWESASDQTRQAFLDRAIIVERKCAEHGTILARIGTPIVEYS